MIAPDVVSYALEIYTGVTCWRGEVNYASARRLTDLLNDTGHGYVELERASLITWEDHSPRAKETFGSIAVSKKNAIVVVCHGCPVDAPANTPERVAKVTQRVAVYAPPIMIVGNLHTVAGASVLNALDYSRQNFLPLTSAGVMRMDGKAALATPRGLALINRDAITAIQPVPTQAEDDESALVPLHVSRMIAVAHKVASRTLV